MKNGKIMKVVLGLFAAACLSGCAMFNSAKVQQNRTTTIGQELIDLQEARDKGAVSEEEYNKLKDEIMKGGIFFNTTTCVKKCGSE